MSFDTLVNFRDLGGYQTTDGKKIQFGRLLRSGEPVGLSSQDIKSLVSDYDLKEIIDFRTAGEVEKSPDDKIGNVNYHHLDVIAFDDSLKDEIGVAPSLKNMLKEHGKKTASEQLTFVYNFIIDNPASQKNYYTFFNILAKNTSGSCLWHCFAGKDRTGLAAALVLYILGAPREVIFKDYLLTNIGRKKANDVIIAEHRANGVSEEKLADLQVKMEVRADYLESAIIHIKATYGSVDNYIRDILKITDNDIISFRENYLI